MKKSLLFSLYLFGEIGFSVSIPLVGLALLGRYLDKIFNTNPYLFITGIIIATVIVYFFLKKNINKYSKQKIN